MGRYIARMNERRIAFKILTGKHTGKRPLGRPRRGWEDNIRMEHENIGINYRKRWEKNFSIVYGININPES